MDLVAGYLITGASADTQLEGLAELAHVLYRRPYWFDYAACRRPEHRHVDFFPGRGESVEPALAVCATCTARWPCRQDAVADVTRHGVWGGTTQRQRARLRAADAAEAGWRSVA